MELKENMPEVEKMARIRPWYDYLAQYTPEDSNTPVSTTIRYFAWTDEDIFDIFSFEFLSGNPKTALVEPNTIVLTNRIARILFGNSDPMNKTIRVNNSTDFTVTGVIKTPERFHLEFESLASFKTYLSAGQTRTYNSYDSWNLPTYILLPEAHDKSELEAKVTALFESRMDELYHEKVEFKLFPLEEIHFLGQGLGSNGNLQMIYILIAIAVFILMIACINFVNLTTARASIRAKENSIRKVVGASRIKLINQFLIESVIFCILSTAIALLMARLCLPAFNNLVGENLTLGLILNSGTVYMVFAGIIGLGFLSGIYPAFYLTAFNPVTILKGNITKGKGGAFLRKGLIVFQFTISIILIIGTFTVFNQLNYMQNINLGINSEQIINFDLQGGARSQRSAFKDKILQHQNIKDVSYSWGCPGRIFNNEGLRFNDENIGFAVFTVDPDFKDVYGLEISEGRWFSRDIQTDQIDKCVINEEAVRQYGFENPVGSILGIENISGSAFTAHKIEIIGVVKDFHFESLHSEIRPLIFNWNKNLQMITSVKISSENMDETIAYLENSWKEFSPEFPFEYTFFDEAFNAQYNAEKLYAKLAVYFAVFAIFIACLGLFGLVSFIAARRTKEIGIRKVLGASNDKIFMLLSSEFVKWVVVSNIIAWPTAYFAMNKWLENFAYKADIGILTFLTAGSLSILISLLTVSYQSTKAATANPVDSLMYE
jgi:putative ABC transport system permease protein